jgi:TonB family protein
MKSSMNATADRNKWVGRVIDGRFPLLEWLGGSGRSAVYLTEMPGDPTQKATIKLIPADDEGESRVADWAAAADLSHPHLIRPLHIGRCKVNGKRFVYAVTEYANEVLAEILPVRALTPEEAKEMLGPVIDVLSYLHAEGFVHRRLKPTNIMVVGDNLKLSVDGIGAVGDTQKYPPALTVYDAPERANGTASPASDIWSLGVTLVEALTQHAPDWNRSATTGPAIPESVPQPYFGIARRCLQLDSSMRCTPGDIKALIGLAQAHLPPAGHIDEETEAKSKTPILLGIAVFIVAAVAVAIAVFWMRTHQTQSSSPAGEQQRTQAPAPAQPGIAQEQPQSPAQQQPQTPATAPQEQPPAQAPVPAADQAQAPAKVPAQAPTPANPPPVTAAPTGGGATVKGAVAQRVQPDVAASASRTIHGTISVRVHVNVAQDGNVSNATLDSAGPSKYFARVAMQAAQRWKFKPAQVNGHAAPSEWMLQFHFTRNGSDVTPLETTP